MYWSHPYEPIETLHEYTEREAEDERRAIRIEQITEQSIVDPAEDKENKGDTSCT